MKLLSYLFITTLLFTTTIFSQNVVTTVTSGDTYVNNTADTSVAITIAGYDSCGIILTTTDSTKVFFYISGGDGTRFAPVSSVIDSLVSTVGGICYKAIPWATINKVIHIPSQFKIILTWYNGGNGSVPTTPKYYLYVKKYR